MPAHYKKYFKPSKIIILWEGEGVAKDRHEPDKKFFEYEQWFYTEH